MEQSILEKQQQILLQFSACESQEAKYKKIIEMGAKLPHFDSAYKTPENLVRGCQSLTYLHHEIRDGKMFFYASSEAFISAGLASLLIQAYNGETAEAILTSPPEFIRELNLGTLLSPGRSNGLMGMYARIRELSILSLSKKPLS